MFWRSWSDDEQGILRKLGIPAMSFQAIKNHTCLSVFQGETGLVYQRMGRNFVREILRYTSPTNLIITMISERMVWGFMT
jgi:hypothetical protein